MRTSLRLDRGLAFQVDERFTQRVFLHPAGSNPRARLAHLKEPSSLELTIPSRQAGFSKVPGLLPVPRHSAVRSLLALESACRTPSASKSLP